MSSYSTFSALVSGVQRQVNLSTNTLVVGAIQINGVLLSSTASGNAGSKLVGDDNSYSNFTPAAATVKGALSGIDTAIGAIGTNNANKSLSNLTATSINQSLIPSTFGTFVLGSATDYWGASFISSIFDSSGTASVQVFSRILQDAAGITSINWTSRLLEDAAATTQLSWSASGVAFNQLTATTVPYLNSSKVLTSSSVTPTQLAYLAGASGTSGTGSLAFTASPTFTGTLNAAAASFTGALNMNSQQINGLAMAGSPASTDAVNVSYLNSQIAAAINGLTWKGPVSVYANSNFALTGGATLTIDSYAVQNGNYVILANQTTATQNGVYLASGIGTAYTLTLQSSGSEAATALGDAYLIMKGSVYGNTAVQVNQLTPNVTFIQFAGPNTYTFNFPLSLSGNVLSLLYDNSTIGVNGSNQLYVPASGIGTSQIAAAAVTAAKLGTITDGVTLDQSGAGSTLEIKSGGVGTTQLAAAAVTATKLGTITDGVTLDQSGAGSTLEIKTGGVGTTQLAAAAVTSAKVATGVFDQATITGGAGTPAAVQNAPVVSWSEVAGQTFVANTTYAVRYGLQANSETSGRVYAADITTSSFDLFWVIGFIQTGASAVTAGGSVTVISSGSLTLKSADTAFLTADPGKPIYLQSGGLNATTTPPSTSGQAVAKLGIVQTTSTFRVQIGAPSVA